MGVRFRMVSNRVVGCGCEICGCGWVSPMLSLLILVVVVDVVVFYLFIAIVANIGGRWLICWGGWWLWAVAVDLWVWVIVDDDDRDELIYYFNV